MNHWDRARAIVDLWAAQLATELPENAYLFDVHTHLGHDIDGMNGWPEELLGMLDRYGFDRAFTFCMDEYDREPAFSVPNDRTLAHAERSGGRFVPFVRLDLGARPVEEARRCLDLGARGIKLHPRAQAFTLDDERLPPIFELAVDRSVPILIHGGRGLPPIADHLAHLVRRYEGIRIIIAHAGIADMGGLAGALAGLEGVFFDTSVWSAVDLLDLFRQVAPEQIVFASDYPYGRLPNSLLMALRTARVAEFDDSQLRALLGETGRRIADREPLPPLSSPKKLKALGQPLTFARIHQYISMAVPMLWMRQRDGIGALGLAVNASRERNGYHDESEQIQELLMTAEALWKEGTEVVSDDARVEAMRTAIQLVNLADLVAITTRA